jgi:hypothetical protein
MLSLADRIESAALVPEACRIERMVRAGLHDAILPVFCPTSQTAS